MSAWYNKTMAFPGELNINYYKGDTHEFKVYPQNTSGAVYSLSDFSNATFTIAESRGAAGIALGQINASARISSDGTNVTCAITPENGALMDSTKTYVYDIQVYAQGPSTYDKIFTLLTGLISVTDDVTQGIGSTNSYIPSLRVIYHNTNATGGSVPVDSTLYSPNRNIVIMNQGTLVRQGYTFAGWTTTSDGTGTTYIVGNSHPLVNSDIRFYPKWTVA